MTVSKPSWLSRALDLLNWDIFTWKVYIGDAVEGAIDWALGWVNWGIDQAKLAYNKAVDTWYKALEWFGTLRDTIYRETGYLWNRVNAWASSLAEWWEGKKTTVQGWIDAAKSWAKERIDDVRTLLNRLDIAWDNFKRDTLPRLLDTQWVRDFFGEKVKNISDWWAARRTEVGDLIDTEVTPVRDEVNKHSSWLDLIKELFTDPEKWLMDRIESMLARFL